MWVCVGGVGFTVGGPAGVGDADGTADVFVFDALFEGDNLAFGFENVELAFGIDERDAGTVVAAIFQTMEAFNKNGVGFLIPDVSYNSAHSFLFNKWLYYINKL